MTFNNKIMAVSALGLMIIAGCSRDPAPVVQYTPQPQVIQAPAPVQYVQPAAPASHDSGVGTAIMAGAAGYMLGSSGNRSGAAAPVQHTTVVHKTTVVQQAPRRPVYQAQAPAPKQGYFTKRTTTTTSFTKKARR